MTDKPTMWEFRLTSDIWGMGGAHYEPHYSDFAETIENKTLTELHAIAREHWAEEHNADSAS